MASTSIIEDMQELHNSRKSKGRNIIDYWDNLAIISQNIVIMFFGHRPSDRGCYRCRITHEGSSAERLIFLRVRGKYWGGVRRLCMRKLVAGHVEMHASHMHSPLLTSPVSHVSYVCTHVMCMLKVHTSRCQSNTRVKRRLLSWLLHER